MKLLYTLVTPKFLLLILLFSGSTVNAQDNSYISNAYKDYSSAAREVVYLHLNKSIYIKGEDIGFTAYVMDKKEKKPSLLTTNLYVSIEDENEKTITQQLIKIENGIASNAIEIDSSFSSGYYNIKAYTNWMRNFNEQNYFIESIQIIDPEKEKYIQTAMLKNEIDAQFLPEGGHLLNGIMNKIGVVLKDTKGYGIPSVKGTVIDQNDNLITNFKVNQLGIGNFLLLAEQGKRYKININYLNKDHFFDFNQKIEKIGVSLSLTINKNKAIVSLSTNPESHNLIKRKVYKLVLHNGDKINSIELTFGEETKIIKAFDLNKLPPGVNILTLFNENNQPISERIFFNYNGVNILKSSNLSTVKENDSLNVKLNFNDINSKMYNNLSVSVLPQETKSYNRHHNLISYTYLQPYLNGTIEDAKFYFTNINEKKKNELDNLLITQGWSSYNWDNIFSPIKSNVFKFEKGIQLKANINGKNDSKLLEGIYTMQTKTDNKKFFEISETNNNYFYIDSLFPVESERIYLSKFEDETFSPTKFYIQASPSEIPNLFVTHKTLLPKSDYKVDANLNDNVIPFENFAQVQKLDEVIVKSNALETKKLRIEKLNKYPTDKIVVYDEATTKYIYLSHLIANNGGFNVEEDYALGILRVSGRGYNSGPPPVYIYIDDVLANKKDLFMYPARNIDYILFKTGLSLTDLGKIRVYTKEYSEFTDISYKKQEFEFPLTFKSKKIFYAPKYQYYNDSFFKSFGTIDWKPNLVTDSNGNIKLKIAKPEVPITLFIEGIANDGSFIFEEKTVSIN